MVATIICQRTLYGAWPPPRQSILMKLLEATAGGSEWTLLGGIHSASHSGFAMHCDLSTDSFPEVLRAPGLRANEPVRPGRRWEGFQGG